DSRDPGRYACKLKPAAVYQDILSSPRLDALVRAILGPGYELSHFSSHNAMPGCGDQLIHVDGTNGANSNSAISIHDAVLYIHIPLEDVTLSQGPTELWPFTDFTDAQPATLVRKSIWVDQSARSFHAIAKRGDVILKS